VIRIAPWGWTFYECSAPQGPRRSRARARSSLGWVLVLLSLVPALAAAAPGYVDNDACLGCHETQARAWVGSQHARAMQIATAETVRGDFGGAVFEHDGVRTRFFRRGERFLIETPGPDGKPGEFEVRYTFGVEPLQQYLLELPGGRMQAFTVAWDTRRKRWFHLYPDEKTPPGDVLHWSGRYQNWNQMCAACHSTNLVRGYDAAADSYRTTWSELEVTCQSCHGPGAAHVAWARARAGTPGPPPPAGAGDDGLAVHFRSDAPGVEIEVCAACHARRSELTADPVPGRPLYDDYLPALLDDGLYFADGQQQSEVYVYGSFRQSRMYQFGVRCSDCHEPHSGGLKGAGNAVCTQCHRPAANPRFPTAAGRFDDPAHTHHAAGTPGSSCVACHMPARPYMIVDPRHDHGMRVPRPDLSVKLGVPNACNDCHAKESAQWAADAVAKWYGVALRQKPHFAEALAAGRALQPGASAALAQVAADRAQPAIVRATALDLLRDRADTGSSVLLDASRDADPAVRVAAADALESLPPAQRVPAVAPLLADPLRAVRITAARVLSDVPAEQFDAARGAALEKALAEYVAAQEQALDTPGAHLNLAVVAANRGRAQEAEAHYRAALRLDPDFTPARANLAQLYAASARPAEAERVLREGLQRVPAQGDLQYMLGLLLSEMNRLPEAADALGKAADLQPGRARVRYNHALALQHLGRRQEAEKALLTAQKADPDDPGISHALAVLYAQEGRWRESLEWAERLQSQAPNDPAARQLVDGIRQQAGAQSEPRPPGSGWPRAGTQPTAP